MNKKIKNATKTVIDNIQFDSKLEGYMYSLLKMNRIAFELKPKFELQPKFKYFTTYIRAITYTSDFYLPDFDILIDTKGFKTEASDIRIKMLKHCFYKQGKSVHVLTPKNNKECETLLLKLIKAGKTKSD